jgi:hypothetical protein
MVPSMDNDHVRSLIRLTTFADTLRQKQPMSMYTDTNVRQMIGRLPYRHV